MKVGTSADRRHAAAAENGFTFVESGVTHHWTEDGEPAVEVTQTAAHQHTVFTPGDAQLYKRPRDGEKKTSDLISPLYLGSNIQT